MSTDEASLSAMLYESCLWSHAQKVSRRKMESALRPSLAKQGSSLSLTTRASYGSPSVPDTSSVLTSASFQRSWPLCSANVQARYLPRGKPPIGRTSSSLLHMLPSIAHVKR